MKGRDAIQRHGFQKFKRVEYGAPWIRHGNDRGLSCAN